MEDKEKKQDAKKETIINNNMDLKVLSVKVSIYKMVDSSRKHVTKRL